MYMHQADNNYRAGVQRAAASQNPVFEGIEQDVQNLVAQSFLTGKLDAGVLADERTWLRAAQLIRLERGELDRITGQVNEPVSSDTGDIPTQIKSRPSGFGNIALDESSHSIMETFGLTPEQARKLVAEERAERGGI
jgi:hypothetical protein